MKLKITLIGAGMLIASVAHGQQDSSDLARPVFGNQVVNQPDGYDVNAPENRYNDYNGRGSGVVNQVKGNALKETEKAPDQVSINPGAQTGERSQAAGAGTNAMAGIALMAAGAAMMANPPTVPPGVVLMMMGIMAMQQSGHDSNAAGQSHNTYNESLNGDTTQPGPLADGSSGFDADKLKDAEKKLGEAGYQTTKNGFIGPDGKLIPHEAFNSADSIQAAGLDPQGFKEAQSILDGMNTVGAPEGLGKAVSGVPVAGGGGGGSSSAGDGSGSEYSSASANGSNPFGLNADDKRKLIAGKTVMFDGEPIGVRGNNIFEMVHQCYQKKRQGNHFIEAGGDSIVPASVSASSPVSMPVMRAPASTRPVRQGSNR